MTLPPLLLIGHVTKSALPGRVDIEILGHQDIGTILSDTGKTWYLLQELQASLTAQHEGFVLLGLPSDPDELLEHLEDNVEQEEFMGLGM